jgi:hypothetical protein
VHSESVVHRRTVPLPQVARPVKSVVQPDGALHVVDAPVNWHCVWLPFPVIVPQQTTPASFGGYAAS